MRASKSIWLGGVLTAFLSVLAGESHADLNGCDNFNDNSKDTNRWGPPVPIQGTCPSCGGLLTETNGRLEFTKSSGCPCAFVAQPWILNFGSYTQNWEVQIDVSVPDRGFAESVFHLGVISGTNADFNNPDSDSNNRLSVGLFESGGDSPSRTFLMRFGIKGSTNFPKVADADTTSVFGSLRIAFDASTKVLSSYYDEDGPVGGYSWKLLGSTNIATGWSMTSTSLFGIFVSGRAEADVVSSSDNLFADNFCASSGPPQAPPFQWARHVASTTNCDDELSIGLAIDSTANVYVTGWFDGTNDFGGVILTNKTGGGQDIFVAKFNASAALQWARRAGSDAPPGPGTHDQGRDAGRGIGVDAADNVYVTGGFFGNADFGPFNLNATTNRELFLAKYDSTGTVQWVRQSIGGNGISNPGWDDGVYGTGLAVDGAGNCYIVGFAANVTPFGDPVMFGSTSLDNTNADGGSAFIIKYDSSGAVRWAKSFNCPGESYATKIAVDVMGNSYVKGGFDQSMRIGTNTFDGSGARDMFLAKFDSSGNLVWVRQETASGGEGGVAVDQSGNVYVTGAFNNDVNLGGVTLTNAGSFDAYLVKYSSSGVFQWARRAGGTNFDFYWDAAVDLQGNVYAAGVLGSAAVGPSGLGAIIAKYDGSGTLQWVTSAGSPAANPLSSIAAKCAVDSSGNSYIAGWYQTATTFGTNALQPQSPAACWNYFLAKSGWTRPTLGIEGSNSVIRLSVFGDINNRFVLEYISRFVASNYWNSLSTTTFVRSPMILTDTNTGSSSRFYRARLVP